MGNDIDKIINSLKEASASFGILKEKLASQAGEIGFQEEFTNAQIDLWKDLKGQDNVPTPITASGAIMSEQLAQQSRRVAQYVLDSRIDNTMFTVGTASETMAGTVVSGASISYPPGQLPKSYFELNKIMDQRSHQKDISQKLKQIDRSLADEYDNAWINLRTSVKDKTRSPMFLIREVIGRLYKYFAPDKETREFFELNPKKGIERKYRIEYIASKITDPDRKQAFLNEKQAFENIYKALSKAHKPGSLDIQKTKGLLYQASALIRLLLESLDLK